MADIYNTASNTLLSGTSGDDTIDNGGYWNGYRHDGGSNVTIDAGGGNDSIDNYGDSVTINAGAGNDTIWNYGDEVTINAGAGNDSIHNEWSNNVSINGGAGNDSIYNEWSDQVTIDAGAGNDSIFNDGGDSVTINAGAGNDTLYIESDGEMTLKGGDGADLFIFKYYNDELYGTDYITDYSEEDTIQFGNLAVSKVSTTSAGHVVFKVGDNKLVVKKAADKVITYIGADGSTKTYGEGKPATTWQLDGTTATYGSLTVKGVTSTDGLSLDGKTLTVNKNSLGTDDVTISDGYTLKLGSDVDKPSTENSWTLSNSTATYKQTTTAGYSLSDNKISYTKKSSKTLATVKGVTSLDGLSVSGKVIMVSKNSLGTSKVTISDGYTLKLADDVDKPSTKNSWTLSNSTATYKQTTAAGYKLSDNTIVYSKKISSTLATVKGVNDKSGLKVSGKTIKLSGDSLAKKVTVSGAYTFDFAADYSKATITGSSSDDTIIARGKNILLKGGKGSDTFAVKPTAANVISDYEDDDKISLTSGAADFSVSGSDLIINGKISVKGAADKVVTYIDTDGEHRYEKISDDVEYNAEGTGATLTAKYSADEFTPSEYADFADMLKTIDASAVDYNLKIVGNKRANEIFGTNENDYIEGAGAKDTIEGGDGNDVLRGGLGSDSLWGGADDDILTGGDGYDFFIYKKGDGNDTILDYESGVDTVMILSGAVKAPTSDGTDVIFKVGSGQITFVDGAKKYIELVDKDGNQLKQWTPK